MPFTDPAGRSVTGQQQGYRVDPGSQPGLFQHLPGCRLDDSGVADVEVTARLHPQLDSSVQHQAYPGPVGGGGKRRSGEVGRFAVPGEEIRPGRQPSPGGPLGTFSGIP